MNIIIWVPPTYLSDQIPNYTQAPAWHIGKIFSTLDSSLFPPAGSFSYRIST